MRYGVTVKGAQITRDQYKSEKVAHYQFTLWYESRREALEAIKYLIKGKRELEYEIVICD